MKIYRNGLEIAFTSWTFPAGERGFKLDPSDFRFMGEKAAPTTIIQRAINSEAAIGFFNKHDHNHQYC